ncbi:MAG: hypothetical protein V1724_07065, partial [Chloroflexota bacterium]
AELHALVEERQQRPGLHVGYHPRPHLSPSAQDAKDRLLARPPASLRALGTLSEALVAPGAPQGLEVQGMKSKAKVRQDTLSLGPM